MTKPTVTCVAGARPNFMKIKPILDALDRHDITNRLVHTGQHYDQALSDVFFDDLGLRQPDRSLGVGSGSHAEQTGRVMTEFEREIDEHRPDIVVVVGDVNSTLACAIVASKAGVRVAHVEAGLRSRDWSMPEEINRVLTDRASDLLFAPSSDAVETLETEGYRADQIHLAGNTMIDTLLANRERAAARPIRASMDLERGGYGLVTLHRPANVDDPDVLDPLVDALEKVAESCPLVFPVHPRTRQAVAERGPLRNISVIDPTGYLDFLALEEGAALVLTDSGGVQEETTALGVPCLTLRDNTERPITVDEGTNRVVGTEPNRIIEAAIDVLDNGVAPRCPALWDGRAGERIAAVLGDESLFSQPRPTDLP
jgi:UDP-N-acetylglucosamine 2-epimerase (non-hydrolysing)